MKRRLRLEWSVDMMQKGGRRLRFLTLTVPENDLSLKIISERWRAFRRRYAVQKMFKGHSYAMVYERHPGGHGWHIHVVLNVYLPINELRRWTTAAGFGRIHIKLCGRGIGQYMAKYINKSALQRTDDCKGLRMINVSRDLIPLRDIKVSSDEIDFIKRNMDNPAVAHLRPFERLKILGRSWRFRKLPPGYCFILHYYGQNSGLVFG